MATRDLDKELKLLNGVWSANAIASIDPYYGPFDNLTDAYDSVPVGQRKVTKLVAIYTDATKTFGEIFIWTTDLAGTWGIQKVNDRTLPYQIITLGDIIFDIPNSKVTVNVDKIGFNQIRLNGTLYVKSSPSEFIIDPIVTPGNFRKDIIEARPNSTLFYLKKGIESTSAVAPNVSAGSMLIQEVLVTSVGVSNNPSTLTPATVEEVQNQTPPTTETNRAMTSFNIWKWRDALTYLVLKTNVASSIISNALRFDGIKLKFAISGTEEKELAFEEPNITITTSVDINSNSIDSKGVGQYGKNVILNNGSNAINYQVLSSSKGDFTAVITKAGTANITFTAGSGVTITQVDYTNILNGGVGSTAKLQRIGNVYYLRIFNA